jgi:hypothetical protein
MIFLTEANAERVLNYYLRGGSKGHPGRNRRRRVLTLSL